MRIVLGLLSLAGCLQLFTGFAMVAANIQRGGDQHMADIVGFTGGGVALVVWLVSLLFIRRAA